MNITTCPPRLQILRSLSSGFVVWQLLIFATFGLACGAISSSPLSAQFAPQPTEMHLAKGLEELDQEKYARAAEEFQQAARTNPKNAQAFYYLGFSLWKMMKIEPAADAFGKALALDPADGASQYYLGRIHLLRGETERAIHLFETLTKNGQKPVADEHYQLGLAYLKKGDAPHAIEWLEKAVSLRPRDSEPHSSLGKAYQQAGRSVEADKEFQTASQIKNWHLEVSQLMQQCRQLLAAKDIAKALEIRSKLLGTDELEYLVALGTLFGESGLPDQALEPLLKAVSIDRGSFEAHFNLGYTYLNLGKSEQAEEHLSQASLLRPGSFEAHSLLGVTRANLGKNLPAIESFRKAYELRPDNLRVVSLLVLQYLEGRYYSEAIKLLNRAIPLHEADVDLRYFLIQALYKNHDTEKALQTAQATLRQFPQEARAHYEVGFQLATMGRFRESRPHFEKTLQLNPKYAEASYWLGDLLLKEGRGEEAVTYFRQALQDNPAYVDALTGLARALLELQRYDEAMAALQKAIAADPNEPQPHLHLATAYRALGRQELAHQEAQLFDRLNRQRMKQKDMETIRQFPSR